MEKEQPINKLNRDANIAIAHGCWVNGVYRDNGIPRPSKKELAKRSALSEQTTPFNMEGVIVFNER